MKKPPAKHNPLFKKEENALDFGEDFDPKILSIEEKQDAFLSKYMEVMDPVGRYKKYFESSAKGVDHILRDIKLYYKKLVLEGSWSERKYVEVIGDLFENRVVISVVTLDRSGLMYDKGQLVSQRKVKNSNRRRQR